MPTVPKNLRKCGLKDCERNLLIPVVIGFEIEGKTREVIVCSYHARLISVAPRGTWHITADYELKAIPAKPTIIT